MSVSLIGRFGSNAIQTIHRFSSDVFGKPVVVENRGGAGGSIAAEAVARAPADGYTLMMGHIGTLP